jgi:hypothetical protein
VFIEDPGYFAAAGRGRKFGSKGRVEITLDGLSRENGADSQETEEEGPAHVPILA